VQRWYARFRSSLPTDNTGQLLIDLVEIDESFFGKKRYSNQKVVIGAIEPKTRRIKLQIIDDREQETMEGFVEANVHKETVVMTDSHPSYNDLDFLGYTHYAFNHSKGEYTNTNQIENLWGVIKRYMRKLYGCIPTKHLQSILDEWMARQNNPSLFINPKNYLDVCLFRIS
jgi:transposase-like protein